MGKEELFFSIVKQDNWHTYSGNLYEDSSKLGTELPYNLVIYFIPDMYPKYNVLLRYLASMFIATLITIAKARDQPRYSSADK